MAAADTRLRIFAFPQSWSGGAISLRVLVAPFGNPLQPLDPGLKPFAQASIVLSAQMIPGLEHLPRPTGVTATAPLADAATPAGMKALYNELADAFHVDPAAPPAYTPPSNTRFLKMLMPSYREATGFAPPRTEYAVTDNRYACAITDGKRPNRPPKTPQPPKWDSVLAMALRQPVLAQGLGLIYTGTVTPSDASFFENGGWLYVTLDSTSDYLTAAASPDFLTLYAARIPPLPAGNPQSLFAPVLFRVQPVPSPGSFDEILKEAELYSDGFARLVHTFQADRADYLNLSKQDERRPRLYEETGLRIGWDDEQVVIWLNRQLTDDPRNGSPVARDTPMGVRGFRVDVRDGQGVGAWSSLVRMKGPVQVGAANLGQFDGETAVELAPSQLQGVRDGEYWLPPYFTLWTGGSLIAPDATAYKVANASPGPRVLKPVAETDVPLKYGREYQFRVRLTDLTGGGPDPGHTNHAPDTQTKCRFRRFLPPGPVIIEKPQDAIDPPSAYTIRRPLLGYPAVLYTQLASAESQLLADIPTAKDEGRPPGLPDPDVTRLRIDVSVASLEFDPGNLGGAVPRQHLYSTFREFDDDPAQPIRARR